MMLPCLLFRFVRRCLWNQGDERRANPFVGERVVILEDFVRFPHAAGFPAGPYDLENIEYSAAGGSFSLFLRLGFVYDFYLLKIIAGESVTWEFWHLDSAVMYVEEQKEAENPPFECQPFSAPCDARLRLLVGGTEVAGRVIRISIQAENGDFTVDLELESGGRLVLTKAGWQ